MICCACHRTYLSLTRTGLCLRCELAAGTQPPAIGQCPALFSPAYSHGGRVPCSQLAGHTGGHTEAR